MDSLKNPLANVSSDTDMEDPVAVTETVVNDWIRRGKEIPLGDVPYKICHIVSRCFPPQNKEQWRDFAVKLGVESIHDLMKIEGDAHVEQEWVSYVLLRHCSATFCLSFADLVRALHKLRRMDCLQQLYDQNIVEDFFAKRKSQIKFNSTVRKSADPDEGDVTDLGELPLKYHRHKFKSNSSNDLFVDKKHIPLRKFLDEPLPMPTLLEVVNACKITNKPSAKFPLKQTQTESVPAANNADVNKLSSHQKPLNNLQIRNEKDAKPLPSVSNNFRYNCSPKKVVILLTYSADVNDIVPVLVQRFWNAGIGVVAEWVLRGKGFFETNLISAWESFFKQSHFVVPIISPQYVKDTQHPSTDYQSSGVRFVYDLYTRKYVKDGCLNNVVRPLVTGGMKADVLNKLNPTLEVRWPLEEEFDGFVEMIQKYAKPQWTN